MTAREMANIQILLYEVKRQLQYDGDENQESLLKTIYEVENFLEKQPVEQPVVNWKPYY